ncbi:mechanosensitive ion channel [Niabella yanshanensis]|uniref:Mechanosensitive ion channel n=1 Tax=Niabella yanshanensis TaxID=577386 RepID=A0ABZ0W743_9BACT|nr:mechanosensitive ion channel domain-containing protein [Niabella yanshanensis]WQD37840.1 mechanosensitive ion channel [Niabella yanshanensis]
MKKALSYRQAKLILNLLFAQILLLIVVDALGQATDTVRKDSVISVTDSNSIVEKARRFGEMEIRQSLFEFRQDLAATRRKEILEAIKNETFNAKDFVKNGIDTAGLSRELRQITDWYQVSLDGILINPGTAQTYRNLVTSDILVNELKQRLNTRKLKLDAYTKQLLHYRNKIDSFATDSALFITPADSMGAVQYFSELLVAARVIAPADSIVKQAINNVQLTQQQVNSMVNVLSTTSDNIENYQRDLAATTFKRDFSNLGDSIHFKRSLKEIITISALKGELALLFYAGNNIGKIIILFILIFMSYIFIRSLRNRLAEDGRLSGDMTGQLVFRYPFLSAMLIVISIFQFIFILPPFIFNLLLWLSSGISLTIIFRGFITRYWWIVWLTVFVFFIIASGINLVLQASRPERWIMLAVSLSCFFAMLIIFITGKKKELKEKWIIYFIGLAVLLEMGAAIANIYGRYNLSKMLLTTGIFNIVTGISFAWTIRLINEGLLYANELYKTPERNLFYLNFKQVGTTAPTLFKAFFIIGWVILLGRNFYAFNRITDPVIHFMAKTRTLGAYSFTITHIATFFGILIIATVVSKVVSFFAADKHDDEGKRVRGIGSWLLLVRIAIISAGIFLAFAAAGIPLDKITIIVGALSVGIGFGLQTLINNLVSGLIISFEKPVNVGDIVEIRGRTGTMKSIGFRSSIMTTSDGAEVVIPNGDLLNEHLVNWTLNDATRRVDIMISVAYGTDLEKIKPLVLSIVSKDKRIAHFPAPVVLVKDFAGSSIDFLIHFWATDIREWSQIKSDVLIQIEKAFNTNNITIPLPAQDIYMHAETKTSDSSEVK